MTDAEFGGCFVGAIYSPTDRLAPGLGSPGASSRGIGLKEARGGNVRVQCRLYNFQEVSGTINRGPSVHHGRG